MSDKKAEAPGGWDAKNNARRSSKDAAGKAMGYEDAGAKEREDQALDETKKKSG
jgi:hypothetical protein